MSFLVVGVLALLLRWAFSRGKSVVARPARPGGAGDYGLLVAVAAPQTYVQGELLRRTLDDAGLRATLATTTDGPRLMVFASDERQARRVLAGLSG
ncbi:hypothetical protein G9H71_06365 [Motilibacter sp. E257]|uniref:DUF2007 domain-containing protein n=2 Tax=Motilibacter deserti TaxID=2714956 RepID=A0ABX0GSC5_9ACTN|nr:hypothetical protein [Motilibacter deserti]